MQKISLIFSILYACFCCVACQPKEETTTTPKKVSILGNWKLYSEFSGYHNGGDFQWHDVIETANQHLLNLRQDGTMTTTAVVPSPCSGRYSLVDSTLTLSFNCSTPYSAVQYLNSVNDSTLILKELVDEGYVLSKYKKQ